jgi:hypothetical protein
MFRQPSFPRMVRPIKLAPIHLSLEGVSVHTGHEVLIKVDFHFTDCWQSTTDFRPTAQVGNTKGGGEVSLYR